MGYKITIKDKTYDLKDGFTIKEEYNETLDSGTVQFATYGEELNKEPFDKVTIFHTDSNVFESKHFEVDSISDDIYAFGDALGNNDHLYTMSLFSETKDLERITLPSCSITQPTDNSTRTTVWDAISRFCSDYLPRVRVANGGSYTYEQCYVIDPAVQTKFQNVECPELQWDNPTLKEVLNDLMSTKDCIVVIRNYVLSFYDLTEVGSPIDTSKLTRMTSNFSSNDYISELTMYMKNGVGKNFTKSFRYQTPRTIDESGEITTNNMCITTQKPIYSVKSLKIYFIDNQQNRKLHCADVASRVIEYDNFRIKSRIYVSNIIGSAYRNLPWWTDANGCALPEHQMNYLYYKRGGFSIENLGKIYEGSRSSFCFLSSSYPSILNALRAMGSEEGETVASQLLNNARDIFYEIEYETLYDQAMHFGRNIPNSHPDNRVFDNQSNAYIDVQHQSIFEYTKVNRLSNQIKEIYGEYESESEIPSLGDYIGDYVLFNKEVTYYDHKLLFKGFLTKNYILKDYFTGVMAKKRSWQIASQNEALSKHEIMKIYVEASFERKIENSIYGATPNSYFNTTGHNYGLIYDLTYLKKYNNDVAGSNILNEVKITTFDANSVKFPVSDHSIALDSDVEALGMSLCWTFGFEDNYKASDYAEKTSDLYTQNFYPYANGYGKFKRIYIGIMYHINDYITDADGNSYTFPTPWEFGGDVLDIGTSDVTAIKEQLRKRPLCSDMFDNTEYGFYLSMAHTKDTREIFKATVQFEYCSDSNDIIIKPKFLEFVRAINTGANNAANLRVYISFEETYNIQDTQAKGTAYALSYLGYYGYSAFSLRVFQTVTGLIGMKSWCVATTDGEILFAVNGDNRQVYFNLLRSRDTNIYYSVTDRTVVGDITESGLSNLAVNAAAHEQQIQQTPSLQQSTIQIRAGRQRLINVSDLLSLDDES